MTFIINSPDFFLASLKEIVICKNNSIRVFLNPSFNIPIFSSWSGRLNELFQLENIKEDKLAPPIHKQEEMEAKALDADLEIEEKDKETHFNFKLQHAYKIIKIQTFYKA